MLTTILECSLLVVQLFLKIRDVLFETTRLGRKSISERAGRHSDEPGIDKHTSLELRISDLHLANTLVDFGILGKSSKLVGSQLIKSCFALLCLDLRLSLSDLLL
jgi:hypothetical protein